MSRDEDRPGFLDREKKSFSELDRMRRERRGSGEPRRTGPAQQARIGAAKKQYLKEIGSLFAKGKGGGEGERLAQAVRDARGTPGLAATCRVYRDAVGAPSELSLISCFLDAGDPEIAVAGLDALRAEYAAGRLQATPGIRTQLRLLAQSSDDAVASGAEALLERI